MTLKVAAKRLVSRDVVLLRLESGEDLPQWESGAHLDLRLPDDVVEGVATRQYSLCGDPADRQAYEVAVLREEDGRGGSRWIHDKLAEGDDVEVVGPRNNFPLREADHHLFVAGGIGITPLLPMLRSVAAAGDSWSLLYGGRTRASMAFVEELVALGGDRVSIRPQDEHGLLDLADALGTAPDGTVVHACGPEPLLAALEVTSAEYGVPLHLERFVAKAPEPGSVDTDFEVELARSGRVLQVPASRSLLDVLEEAGVPVEYSCREGTCGTCEMGVLEGEVDHRDSLLEDDERAANDTMFPCVSRCLSRRLVLDC